VATDPAGTSATRGWVNQRSTRGALFLRAAPRSILRLEDLPTRLQNGVKWGSQAGGIIVDDLLVPQIEAAWERHVGVHLPLAPSEQRFRARQEVSMSLVRRKNRDSNFGKRIRELSRGNCAVCAAMVNYEMLGVLEAAHVKSVDDDGPEDDNTVFHCAQHTMGYSTSTSGPSTPPKR
jgi:hypothetical protein